MIFQNFKLPILQTISQPSKSTVVFVLYRKTLLALAMLLLLMLSSCSSSDTPTEKNIVKTDTLTWGTFGNYSGHAAFLELLKNTYPEIKLEFISYSGGNRTGYSWAQMRADDIPDIFITTQILDTNLAKERLADLSDYSFINDFSTSILDQVEIDGGIYLLPVNYAMYGIFYNKTLMEEKGWNVPTNFTELENLCETIRAEGLIPGVIGTQLTGNTFSAIFNLAKTDWLTTPSGAKWEQDFLNGDATAQGMWENTMDYVQRYIDIGMFYTDPEDRDNSTITADYLGNRKAVFCTTVQTVPQSTIKDSSDELSLMPYISEDGSKNIYMYSPSCYFGISKRLTEPGNEKNLERAIQILSLLFSPEGQMTLLGENSPCSLSVLNNSSVSEDAIVYDSQQAMRDGRAFPMTYTHWEGVLVNMGQVFKEWFRQEGNLDGATCIARMDELQKTYLESVSQLYYCESTADFTEQETAQLVGKALGSTSGADAVMVSLGGFREGGFENRYGVNGKLYAGRINDDVKNTIAPNIDGEYARIQMTGAQAKELAQTGFQQYEECAPFPYILVTRGGMELKDDEIYQIAFLQGGYTNEIAETYPVEIVKASLRNILYLYLKEQKRVSPDGNPWE